MLNNIKIKLAFWMLRKEEKDMAVVYATLIIKGGRTFAQVPEVIRSQVREVLIMMEVDEKLYTLD